MLLIQKTNECSPTTVTPFIYIVLRLRRILLVLICSVSGSNPSVSGPTDFPNPIENARCRISRGYPEPQTKADRSIFSGIAPNMERSQIQRETRQLAPRGKWMNGVEISANPNCSD